MCARRQFHRNAALLTPLLDGAAHLFTRRNPVALENRVERVEVRRGSGRRAWSASRTIVSSASLSERLGFVSEVRVSIAEPLIGFRNGL